MHPVTFTNDVFECIQIILIQHFKSCWKWTYNFYIIRISQLISLLNITILILYIIKYVFIYMYYMYIPINYTCKKGINTHLKKTFKSNLLSSSGFFLLKMLPYTQCSRECLKKKKNLKIFYILKSRAAECLPK